MISSSRLTKADNSCSLKNNETVVSIIIPFYNAALFLNDTLNSILSQTIDLKYCPCEVSLFDDSSSDESYSVVNANIPALLRRGYSVVLGNRCCRRYWQIDSTIYREVLSTCEDVNEDRLYSCLVDTGTTCLTTITVPGGVAFGKNSAIKQSSGKYLCFLDADDMMLPTRLECQLWAILRNGPDCLIGCRLLREPRGSTARHIDWLNGLSDFQLKSQRFRECTLAAPGWMLSRKRFDILGGFQESSTPNPEDMILFYRHLELGGTLFRAGIEPLVIYRYHEAAMSLRISRKSILLERIRHLECSLLNNLTKFSIWSAGKKGKEVYREMSPDSQKKVVAFIDVDVKKVGTLYFNAEMKIHIPILHFNQLMIGNKISTLPYRKKIKTVSNVSLTRSSLIPVITCVNIGLTNGGFESNLLDTQLKEGVEFFYFS